MSADKPQKPAGPTVEQLPALTGDVQQNLQRLDRLANLGLFSASIAHEIKNGLVAINTFVEVMLEKGENREMAEVVRRELKRIDGLVTQMLRFAAPKPATLVPVNVHVLLEKGENRERAEVVRRELKRIDGLVTQMLRFAAPKPATLVPVNVHVLLD